MGSQIRSPLPAGISFFKPPRENDRERAVRLLKRKRLKPASKGLKAELKKYDASAQEFFAQPENRLCLICLRLAGDGEKIEIQKATERHHIRGRIGRLLNWRPGQIPSCFLHRNWPHANPKRARKLGLLCAPQEWNVFPE